MRLRRSAINLKAAPDSSGDRGSGQRRPTARRKSCPVSADCGPDPRRASRRKYRGGQTLTANRSAHVPRRNKNDRRHRRAKTGPRTLRISEEPRSIFLLAKSTAIVYLSTAISLPPRFMAEHENNGTKSQQPNMSSQHVTGRFHKLLCELLSNMLSNTIMTTTAHTQCTSKKLFNHDTSKYYLVQRSIFGLK